MNRPWRCLMLYITGLTLVSITNFYTLFLHCLTMLYWTFIGFRLIDWKWQVTWWIIIRGDFSANNSRTVKFFLSSLDLLVKSVESCSRIDLKMKRYRISSNWKLHYCAKFLLFFVSFRRFKSNNVKTIKKYTNWLINLTWMSVESFF